MKRLEDILKKLPGLNCKSCGFSSCVEMAKAIVKGEKNLEDCSILSKKDTFIIRINDKEVMMGNFVRKILKKTLLAMISSLKTPEIKSGDVIEIRIIIEEDDLNIIKYEGG